MQWDNESCSVTCLLAVKGLRREFVTDRNRIALGSLVADIMVLHMQIELPNGIDPTFLNSRGKHEPM